MRLIFILLLSGHFILFGQDQIDQSILLFNESNSDKEKAQIASDLAWELKNNDPDSSFYYAKEALRLAILTNQTKIEAYSLADIGNYYKRKEEYSLAMDAYYKSLVVRKELGDASAIASGYNQIGLLYRQQEMFDSAAVYLLKGIQLLRTSPDPKLQLKLFDGYAMSLYHLNKSEVALAYLDSSFVIAESIQDSSVIANVIQRKGVVHQYLGHPLLALKYYKQAQQYFIQLNDINGQIDIKINQASIYQKGENPSLAEQLLLDAEKQSMQTGFDNNLFTIYTNLGKLYEQDLQKSKLYYEKAYLNAIDSRKVQAQIESAISLGLIGVRQNQLDEVGNLILEIESKLHSKIPQQTRYDFYLLKSTYFNSKKELEQALIYSNKALLLKDSLQQDLNHLQDLSAILENERHEKELALEALKTSEAEEAKTKAAASLNRIINWALLLFILLAIFLLYGKRKRLKIQNEKKIQKERFKAELKQKEIETELSLAEESLKLETEIREKIGRDLHDNLGSKLAVIQIKLEGITKNKVEKKQDNEDNTIVQITELVEESCQDMRDISHDLVKYDQSPNSLNLYFNSYCKNISESCDLPVEYTLVGTPYPTSNQIKKELHATVSLLLDNIIKHANAKKVSFQLFYHEDSINVEIMDDGIGFDTTKNNRTGVGLKNAKHRIEEVVHGTFDIDSHSNTGTIVSITIPTKNE